jgi:hypothetical protein
MYFLTTFSGIKKIYRVIFKNQLLGLFFFASFYFRLLSESDKAKYDTVARALGLPSHDSLNTNYGLTAFIDGLAEKVFGKDITGYKLALKDVLRSVSGTILAGKVESLPNTLYTASKTPKIAEISEGAVYIDSTDVETRADTQEWLDYIKENKKDIEKTIPIAKKKKRAYKQALRKKVGKYTESGEVLCLNECKERVKTDSGCYCESDCSKSLVGKTWCYVDKDKCKRGKYLPVYMGKTYDTCNPKITGINCYDGISYRSCKKR